MKPVELLPGERVLWTGKPVRFPIFRAEDQYFVPFSMLWCTLMGWVITEHLAGDTPLFLLVVLGIFALFGCWALFGRLFGRQLALRGTRYTVTNKRVVSVTTVLGFRREKSAFHRDLKRPRATNQREGIGTVLFGDQTFFELILATPRGRGHRVPKWPLELLYIDHPAQVRDLIAAARAGKPVG